MKREKRIGGGGRAALTASLAAALFALLPAAAQAFELSPPQQAGVVPDAIDVVSGDFNGDGDPDLAAVQGSSPAVHVMLGGPGFSFGSPVAYATAGGTAGGIALGDFNGDGDPDLAVATYDNDTAKNVSILLGDGVPGGGAFGTAIEAGTAGRDSHRIAAAQLHNNPGDVHLDLATVDTELDEVGLLLGAGGGTFTEGDSITEQVSDPRDVAIGEFGGDGDLDIAVTSVSEFGSFAKVYKGSPGLGASFDFHGGYAVGGDPGAIEQADLDGDGDPELIVANRADGTVTVLHGSTGTAFSGTETHPVGTAPSGIATADFDLDGDVDIAVANAGSDDVSILPNDPTDGLGAAVAFLADTGPTALISGDFGLDPRPDLALSSAAAGQVTLLLGGEIPPPEDPTPVFQSRAVVSPLSGSVYYQCPGGELTLLDETLELQLDCTVYSALGRMSLTTADAAGVEQTADFYEGDFKMSQVVERSRSRKKRKGGKPKLGPAQTITVLTLVGEKPACASAKKAAPVAHAAGGRGLWGSGRGRFRTRGSRSAATVRGTTWFVGETCAGTLTQVIEGVVSVRDFARKRTITVSAGDSYLAPKSKKRRR